MLVTFSTMQDKLLARTKTWTIRKNAEFWEKRAAQAKKTGNKVFDIWWGNPRNMRRNPNIYKMGIGRWVNYFFVFGKDMTEELARNDGFDTLYDLLDTLAEKNKMTMDEVVDWKWTAIHWEWTYGPFTQEVAKEKWKIPRLLSPRQIDELNSRLSTMIKEGRI